jgi:hypothetical protein
MQAEVALREGLMRADRVEVSWDNQKSKWLVRIINGEEVIRRHFDGSQSADDAALRTSAQKAVADEGYEADAAAVTIKK